MAETRLQDIEFMNEPKSQTPLTDAEESTVDDNKVVPADFARSLELKLQETKLWIEKSNTAQYAFELKEKLQEAERQRDKARRSLHYGTMCEVVDERDQLIKVVDMFEIERNGKLEETFKYTILWRSLLPHVQAKKGNKQ